MSLTGPSSQTIAARAAEAAKNSERHHHPLVFVLRRRPGRIPSRVRHHDGDQREERPGADVPGDEKTRRLAKIARNQEIGDDHQRRPDDQTRTMGEARKDTARGLVGLGRRRIGHGVGRSDSKRRLPCPTRRGGSSVAGMALAPSTALARGPLPRDAGEEESGDCSAQRNPTRRSRTPRRTTPRGLPSPAARRSQASRRHRSTMRRTPIERRG